MWKNCRTMTIMHSENILLQDIYVNSTSAVRRKGSNTDGADTVYVNNVTFRRWTVANGDDGISIKANSTNIVIEDSTFHGGAVALGSIGQYIGAYETIENVTVRNITYFGSFTPVYAKTWTGKQKGYPPNGGGGGLGTIRNISRLHLPDLWFKMAYLP
jgi:galacturan 1,4-alpha-galacturonidase